MKVLCLNNNDMNTINNNTFYKECNLWGECELKPIPKKQDVGIVSIPSFDGYGKREKAKMKYLNKDYVRDGARVEGIEEFPCLDPYKLERGLPRDIIGMDERTPRNCAELGLHGFCYDDVLDMRFKNMSRLAQKARNFYCAFSLHYSILLDSRRCEVVEAIRRHRYATRFLQDCGIPTIQTVPLGSASYFDILFDGLAPNSVSAIENICQNRDKQLESLLRKGIERFIELKSPTMLVVYGNDLNFSPGIPVIYYQSRIQKLRSNFYGKD